MIHVDCEPNGHLRRVLEGVADAGHPGAPLLLLARHHGQHIHVVIRGVEVGRAGEPHSDKTSNDCDYQFGESMRSI